MIDDKHTKGPWPDPCYDNSDHANFSWWEIDGVCRVWDEHNARLIAAAPDLLDALRNLEGQAIQQNEAYGNPNSPTMYEALTEARAAIAKATGTDQ